MQPSDEAFAPDAVGSAPPATPAPSGGERARRPRPVTRLQGVAVALLAGAIVFGACQGDNLFNGNSESVQPKVVGISVPSQVYPGDTLSIQVSAYAPRKVAAVGIQLAGAASLDTTVALLGSAQTATVAYTLKVPLPTYLADTLLIVKAVATDAAGAISRVRSDTVSAVAPPAVIGFEGPDSVRAGVPLRFAVRAMGVRPVGKIRVQLRGALSRLDSILVAQPRRDISDTITFQVPVTDVVDTTLTVDMQAVDVAGLSGFITRAKVPVSIPAPVIILVTAPDTVRAGSALDVSVQARGLRSLTRVSYSLRGAVFRDTTMTVSAPAKTITHSTSFVVPSTSTDSVIKLSVSVGDGSGVFSTPFSKSVMIPTGAPVLDSMIIPGDSLRPSTIMDAHLVAHGSRPIQTVALALRGAYNQDVTATPNPVRTNVTQDISVPLGAISADSQLVVTGKVIDTGGNISNTLQKVIRISDTAPPAVTATVNKTSVAAGRPIEVHVIASDNVGLWRVGVRLANLAKVQVAGDSSTVIGRNRDTTFIVTVPMSPPTKLDVVGFAIDRFKHETVTQPMSLTVVDSAGPVVDITVPVANATVPIGDSLMVTVGVTDMVGIKSIALKGVSIRSSPTSDPVVVDRFVPRTIAFPQPPSTTYPINPTVTRFMLPVSDTIAEPVRIIALATDSLGLTGVDTVLVNMGGPRVEIRSPVNGAPPVALGLPLQVRLFAYDRAFGIDSLRLDVNGAYRDSVKFGPLAASDSVVQTTSITPPVAGQITLTATAWNRRGIVGRAPVPVIVNVAAGGTSDSQRPSVQIAGIMFQGKPLVDFTRVELTDTISVLVRAMDNGGSGIKRMGVTVLPVPSLAVPGIRTVGRDVKYGTALTGEVNYTFKIVPRDFGLSETVAQLGKALSVQLQIHAFAQDGAAPASNCGATAQVAVYDSVPCQFNYETVAHDTFFTAQGRTGVPRTIYLVGGRSLALPGGGTIVDAVVDETRQQVYLSNIARNKIETLKLADTTFVPTGGANSIGLVGSQPWGIFLNGTGDSLFVANSGSTTLSVVRLNADPDPTKPALTEDLTRRVFTPNEVLWEVEKQIIGVDVRYKASYWDFSDRPQFIAQDNHGRLLYSTVPTGSAPDGTLRYVTPNAPPKQLEPHMLFNSSAIDASAVATTAIAFLDSLAVVRGGLPSGDDGIILYDHEPGYPNDPTRVFQNPVSTLEAAIAWMQAHVPASDLVAYAGKWIPKKVGLSDTTFMAAARDRGWVAFGEGATTPTGRIMMWDGNRPLGNEQISSEVSVSDLVNNASERVFGLGLNANGTLGIARGTAGAYFFKPDLRLQGFFLTEGQAGGAALHPLNNAVVDATHGLAFVSTPNKSIKILDSVHFYEKGEIQLRDNIVGPVKAALPDPLDNPGVGTPDEILVRLFCVTADASGNTQVVMVNVRQKDLTN